MVLPYTLMQSREFFILRTVKNNKQENSDSSMGTYGFLKVKNMPEA